MVLAGAAIVAGHLALLLLLNQSTDAPAPELPPPPLDRIPAVVGFETPRPPRAPKPRKRIEERARAAAPPASLSAPKSTPAPAPAPAAAPAPAPPKSDYGRWTVAPEAAPAPNAVAGLAGCSSLTLASLTGAAREACAKRLSEMARAAPALPLIADKRKAREIQAWEDYNKAVLDWKKSGSMGPHPCPPQDTPVGKLYLDHCSLVNAARRVSDPHGDHPAVKVEFKVRF